MRKANVPEECVAIMLVMLVMWLARMVTTCSHVWD